jgi:hypothetical protein
MSRTSGIRRRFEALQQRLSQSVETVTRSSRIFIESSDVDDLNPPEDIDEYHDHYREVGIVRGNINQFVRDVTAPGVRVEADSDQTAAYFEGGDNAPASTPPGGFLENCAVLAGERNQPFYPYLQASIVQKYTRGTVLHEYLKSSEDRADPDFAVQGWKHIRPETVSARTLANTNILVSPDDVDDPDISLDRHEVTPRDEAAAYVQFDDNSILGQRRDGLQETEVPLSQNDVLKQVNDPDIGGNDATEDGIFGASPIQAAAQDIEEYRSIKRDRARAMKTKAWGIWDAQFNTEVVETPPGSDDILLDWTDTEIDNWTSDVEGLGPGDIVGHDGSIELSEWEPSLPDIDDDLQHIVDDILAPLPAPKFATAHGEQITQHVTGEQSESYRDLIEEERRAQERDWTQAFREVAERHPDLNPAGIEVKLQPPESSNPIAELDDEQIAKMEQFMSALNDGLGKVPIDSVLDVPAFLQETMDIPEEVFASGGDEPVDESDEQVQQMADEMDLPSLEGEADD